MTSTFFNKQGEPDFDKMLQHIAESEIYDKIAEISFICKVVTARALDRLSHQERDWHMST